MERRIVGRTAPGEEITVEFDAPDSMYEDSVVEQLAITIPVSEIIETKLRGDDGGRLSWYAGNPKRDSVARRFGLTYIQQKFLRMSDGFVDAVKNSDFPEKDKEAIFRFQETLKKSFEEQMKPPPHPLDKVLFLESNEQIITVLELIKSLGGNKEDRLVVMIEDDYDKACDLTR